jgi:hypothetical protein
MSDPLSDRCLYCGSRSVLDDAWFCSRPQCYAAYESESAKGFNDKLRACGLTELLPDNSEPAA